MSPTAGGTINWEPPAYSPDTGLFYVPGTFSSTEEVTALARVAAGLRTLQTGYVVNYALTMLAGAVVLLGFFLAR